MCIRMQTLVGISAKKRPGQQHIGDVNAVAGQNGFLLHVTDKISYSAQLKILNQQKMKYTHDSKILELPSFKKGDMCLLRSFNHPFDSKTSRKLKIHEKGPFIIHSIVNGAALLMDTESRILPDLYSIRLLNFKRKS